MSQCQDILEYLTQGNKLTVLDSIRKFGCYRLSGRIHDLRDRRYKITSKTIAVKGKGGVTKYVAEYSMEVE